MAFQDKFRALMFGIPAGVQAIEIDGEKALALMDAPLELEEALRRWLRSRPELVREDSPQLRAAHRQPRAHGDPLGRVGRIPGLDAANACCCLRQN